MRGIVFAMLLIGAPALAFFVVWVPQMAGSLGEACACGGGGGGGGGGGDGGGGDGGGGGEDPKSDESSTAPPGFSPGLSIKGLNQSPSNSDEDPDQDIRDIANKIRLIEKKNTELIPMPLPGRKYFIDPKTKIRIIELSEGLIRYLSKKLGRTRAQIKRLLKRRYRVRGSGAVVAVRGTDFTVKTSANGATEAATIDGEIEVVPNGQNKGILVAAGQRINISANGKVSQLQNPGTEALRQSAPIVRPVSPTNAVWPGPLPTCVSCAVSPENSYAAWRDVFKRGIQTALSAVARAGSTEGSKPAPAWLQSLFPAKANSETPGNEQAAPDLIRIKPVGNVTVTFGGRNFSVVQYQHVWTSRVATGAKSSALIYFLDGSTITMTENSKLSIKRSKSETVSSDSEVQSDKAKTP